MKVIKATPNEYFQVIHLIQKFCEETGNPFNVGRLATFVADYLRMKDSVILLAMVDGVPVGIFVAYYADNIFDGHLVAQDRLVYVLPEFRNKEVSHRLFKEFKNWAKENGCYEVCVCALCAKDNDSLKNVMEWLGCTTTGYILRKKL